MKFGTQVPLVSTQYFQDILTMMIAPNSRARKGGGMRN